MTPMDPLNLKLIFANDEDVRGMRPIKVLDTMDGLTKNFHPDGLFSTDIFGKVGGEFRNRLFSYIDLKVPIIHPNLYKVITRMKALYEEIIMGKTFATFNEETKDFDKSDVWNGGTGYEFFCSYLDKLVFEEREAVSRKSGIKLLKKYKGGYFITKLLVLPAGLRDYYVDETGKPGEDEINEFYRKIMKTSFSLQTISIESNLEHLDSIRTNLQIQVQALYDHIIQILKGKGGAIQAHWTTRRIFNSTRNVITSHIPVITELGGDRSVGPNQGVVGIYQFLRAAIPLNVKAIREKFSQKVFIAQNAPAALINKKTLKREQVSVSSVHYDKWLTYDGLEKVFANYANESIRHRVLSIDNYYMGLLYIGPDKTFKMIFDIDEIPEDRRETAIVRPITLTEMIYCCVYELSREVVGFMTRYPVASFGGIFPTEVYLRSTVDVESLTELNDLWQPLPFKAMEFPKRDSKFYDSMAPSAKNLAPSGADFDGDKMSFTAVWTQEATDELKELLNNSWSFYISSKETMSFSFNDDVISLVLASMTRRNS